MTKGELIEINIQEFGDRHKLFLFAQEQKKKSEQEITKKVENTEISVIESTVANKEDNTVVEIIAADNETNSTASKTAAAAVKSSTEGNPVLEESSH